MFCANIPSLAAAKCIPKIALCSACGWNPLWLTRSNSTHHGFLSLCCFTSLTLWIEHVVHGFVHGRRDENELTSVTRYNTASTTSSPAHHSPVAFSRPFWATRALVVVSISLFSSIVASTSLSASQKPGQRSASSIDLLSNSRPSLFLGIAIILSYVWISFFRARNHPRRREYSIAPTCAYRSRHSREPWLDR